MVQPGSRPRFFRFAVFPVCFLGEGGFRVWVSAYSLRPVRREKSMVRSGELAEFIFAREPAKRLGRGGFRGRNQHGLFAVGALDRLSRRTGRRPHSGDDILRRRPESSFAPSTLLRRIEFDAHSSRCSLMYYGNRLRRCPERGTFDVPVRWLSRSDAIAFLASSRPLVTGR